jgi:hypothetical protein
MVKLNLEQTGRYEVRTENAGRRAIESAGIPAGSDPARRDDARYARPEIAAQLQQDPELRAIKFVFLTAFVTRTRAEVERSDWRTYFHCQANQRG